jgi:hypothetical protein
MDNLIKVYDNVIGDDYCDKLIEKFECNRQLHQNFDDRGMIFTQVNIQKVGWLTDVKFFSNIFQQYFEKYKEDCGIINQQMPMSYIIEPIRMKRYLPNNYDEFRQHVDVKGKLNCTRFLVFFIYLDNNTKGKTTFPNLGREIDCKKGSLLIFPPMWPWLHAGQKAIRKSKYIIQSYLHYV